MTTECGVCLTPSGEPMMTKMPCGHEVCASCWTKMGGLDIARIVDSAAVILEDEVCIGCGTSGVRTLLFESGKQSVCIDVCLPRIRAKKHPKCPFCRAEED